MVSSPLYVLSIWLRGLLAVAVIALSLYFWRDWYARSHVRLDTGAREARGADPSADYRFDPDLGWNVPTAVLAGAVATSVWSVGGGLLFERMRRRRDGDPLTHDRAPGTIRLVRPDRTFVHVWTDGPAGGPEVILTHGTGANAAEWNPVRRHLARHHRLILWDLPGHGGSPQPTDRDFSLDRLAEDLRLVVTQAAGPGVVLVGHSLGAMTILTLCRNHPALVRDRVAGVVLSHGTYTNPLHTMRGGNFLVGIQKPVIEPLLRLSVALSPLLRVMQWLRYLQGSVHRSTHRSAFSGRESWERLDFVSRFSLKSSPAVLARAALGMLRWDASDVPLSVRQPVLLTTGRRDTTVKPEASDLMHREIQGSRLFDVPQGKHWAPVEFDDDYAREVATFVAACRPASEGRTDAAAPNSLHRRPHGDALPGRRLDAESAKTAPDGVGVPDSRGRVAHEAGPDDAG